MIILDDYGEESLEKAIKEATENRLNPSLRKRNDGPDKMIIIKKGDKKDADQS